MGQEKDEKNKRDYTSASEMRLWLECSYRHKKRYVEGIRLEDPIKIYAEYGKALHNSAESFLKEGDLKIDEAIKEIDEIWKEKEYDTIENWPEYAERDLEWWKKSADSTLQALPKFLDKKFPGWEFIDAEHELKVEFADRDLDFYGLIDAVIKVPMTIRKKKVDKIWLIDWKTGGEHGWHWKKKQDFKTQIQLILYKYFYAKKYDIPLSDIKCGFVIMRRGPDNSKYDLHEVSVGPKSIEKALKTRRNMIASSKRGLALKNRSNCKFCPFEKTKYCT